MNILICPDSFKESLCASDAGKNIMKGIQKVFPDAACKIIPMADGGEGTVEVLIASAGGRYIETTVHDPLMRAVRATYGILSDKTTAVIEMAAASGLPLLNHHERNPVITTTYGTGELIKSALDHNCKRIIVGMGGSATLDAGTGMAQALGIEFKDQQVITVIKGGGSLNRITDIDFSKIDPRLKNCEIIAACDVSNPLTGKNGAAYVYGPQKGATHKQIRTLDENLRHLTSIIRKSMNVDIENKFGTGSAGGLGAGLMAFLNARLESGFDLIAQMVGLRHGIKWADLIITGEGKMDQQTSFGKVPGGISAMAKPLNKPIIAFTGWMDNKWYDMNSSAFITAVPLADKPMSLKQSMADAGNLLEKAAERAMRILRLGMTI